MKLSRLKACLAALALALSATAHSQTRNAGEAIRLNNLGVAYMNQARVNEALRSFRAAFARDPMLLAAHLNEGIALLNAQRLAEARDVLLDASMRQPENPRAWYNLGIAYRNLGQTEPAIAAFQKVVSLDPSDADAFYFLGQLETQARRYADAITMYQRCLDLDSLHASAQFGLARAYQLSGNTDEAARRLARFDELTQSKKGKTISLVYGEQGPYSTAEPAGAVGSAPAGFAVRFSAQSIPGVHPDSKTVARPADRVVPLLGAGACWIDVNGDGRLDLLLPGRSSAVYRNDGAARFTDITRESRLDAGGALSCAIGDYDNDGRDDVLLGRENGIVVYRNEGGAGFRNVTDAAGIHVDGLAVGVSFVDFDHDGDLDIYVSRFMNFPVDGDGAFRFPFDSNGPAHVMLRNNGNGTFTDWTSESGLAGDAPGIAALATDVNNDRAVDFVLTGWRRSAQVLMNRREGAFLAAEPWASAFPSPAAGVAAFDFNKDGWMDLAFTHWGSDGLTVWKNVNGDHFERVPIPAPQWTRGWGLAAVDIDNDGWVDLAAMGEREGRGEIRILRNMGGDHFFNVTPATGLASIPLQAPRALVAADIDGDGDSDLLITQNNGEPVLLRNDGGNRRSSLRLDLRGLNDNKSGIGTKVEVFAGALHQKWETSASGGYLGQSAREIVAGIDAAHEADVVRLLWPTGVIQDEVQLREGRRAVPEIDRRGSSCPVLFSWNGSRYEFVADMIGPGIVGHWVGPGQRNISDPTEYLKVDGRQVHLKDGRLSFRFAEVMEEIVYLDQVRLLAVDHPADVDVYPNEYFASSPPFPDFKVIASRNARPPRIAKDDHGRDVLPELLQRDRRYVAGFDRVGFPGFSKMHYLELELPETYISGPLRLLMQGYIEYFTATSGFAAYQAGIEAAAPFLEVMNAQGRWTRVIDDLGFPAGLARTMTADLSGKLPPGTSHIRIGTNLNIYWDQILVDTTDQNVETAVRPIPLAAASLRSLGYPRQIEGDPKSDLRYDYTNISRTGPYARHSGNFTAYGDVQTLLQRADDRFAIMGSGDEVALEFDPSSLPSPAPGWARDYFFYADGFAKDMDFYEALSDSVAPLPFHAMGEYPYGPNVKYPAANQDYRLNFNTRFVSEAGASSYRFRYQRR